MRQALWTDNGLTVANVAEPRLPDGWVRVAVAACGICGSDLHTWAGSPPPQLGTCPGHEVVGTVVDANGHDLPAGSYAVSPNVICGRCDYCVTGRPNLCRRGGLAIGFGRDGGMAEFMDAPVDNLFAVPDGVDPFVATMAEPLAVAVRAVGLGEISSSSVVLILGAGTIGLLCGLLARDRSQTVAITARHPHQRRLAEQFGVTVLTHDEARSWARQHHPDVVIETVGGTGETMDLAVAAAARGARIIILGSFGVVPVDLFQAMYRELQLIGSYAYGTDKRGPEFRTAVELLPRHADMLRAVQTHQFPLDDVHDAFECALDKSTGSLKVTIVL